MIQCVILNLCISADAQIDTCRPNRPPCLRCVPDPLILGPLLQCCCYTELVATSVTNRMQWRKENYAFHRTMRMLQEPSTVTSFTTWTRNKLGYDKKNFVLDADVQMPISFGGKRWGLNEIQVIPKFLVRIFRDDPAVPYGVHPKGDESLPVRTPSAMPGLAYYRSFRNWWNNHAFPLKFIGLYAYHHSNGQDGPELEIINGQKQVNVYNGNFSEDLVFELIVGGSIIPPANNAVLFSHRNVSKVNTNIPGKQIFIKIARQQEFYWKLSYEWHPKALSNDVFDSLQMMGRHRLNLRTALLFIPQMAEYIGDGTLWCNVVPEERFERLRLTGNINYVLDQPYYRGDLDNLEKVDFLNVNRRLNLWISAYWVLGRMGSAALFGQVGYWASDNYNIYFNQSLWQFKVGLAFAFFDQPDEDDRN